MKLQKLAGHGASAAFVSGGAMLVGALIFIFGPALADPAHPDTDRTIFIVLSVLMALMFSIWPAALVVLGSDLEWREHPATHTSRMDQSLWAVMIAAVMPLLIFLIILIAPDTAWPLVPAAVMAAGISFFLVIHNAEARKAGLLRGVLPWIGSTCGAAFLLMAIGLLLGTGSPYLLFLAFFGWFIGSTCFIFWSIWLGIALWRKPKPTSAPV